MEHDGKQRNRKEKEEEEEEAEGREGGEFRAERTK